MTRPRIDYRPFVFGPVAGLVLWALGLHPPDALIAGLVVLVLTTVLVSLDVGEDDDWVEGRTEESDGTRREISALTWSFVGRDGRVSETAVRRLRAVATRRLARLGVVVPGGLRQPGSTTPAPDDPEEHRERARTLLGDRAWRLLTGPGGLLPSLADVAHCIDAIERLRPAQPAPPAQPSERPDQ